MSEFLNIKLGGDLSIKRICLFDHPCIPGKPCIELAFDFWIAKLNKVAVNLSYGPFVFDHKQPFQS